jgi:hypothetical protein
MSGKATMTVIGNGLAVYDNGAGVRGIVNMGSPSVEVMRDSVRIGADVAGNVQNVYGATQAAQSNDLAKAGSQFTLSVAFGSLFGGIPGLVGGAVFDLVAFKNEDGRGLGLLEANPKANLNYAHEFNFVGSPYYQDSNTTTPAQPTPNYRGAGFNDPRLTGSGSASLDSLSTLELTADVFDNAVIGMLAAIGRPVNNRLTRLESDIADAWNQSKEWTGDLRDPLAIDLDGDGIETIGADGTVVFDHNGDGVKTGTGWVVYPPAHAHRTGWQQAIRHV